MKNKKYVIAICLFAIGLAFLIWGTIIYYQYPDIWQTVRAAMRPAKIQYIVGIVCMLGSYTFLSRD